MAQGKQVLAAAWLLWCPNASLRPEPEWSTWSWFFHPSHVETQVHHPCPSSGFCRSEASSRVALFTFLCLENPTSLSKPTLEVCPPSTPSPHLTRKNPPHCGAFPPEQPQG